MENTQSTHAVELRAVTKRFGEYAAVNNISLQIRQGEFFSLLGPSGCGKTTTLRMVAGFAYPDEGDVVIAGKIVNDVPAYKRDTNLVFQQLALFPHLDVFDNIAFGLTVKGKTPRAEINERVRKALDLVELNGFETRRIKQLSGGQQQRVAIARALINEPAVLLLDEPLGALDLKLRLQMQLELKALQHRVGITFLYVTHDQGEAITMSDRLAVMNKGKLEQIGPSEQIYSRPATRFVASFIGDTNLVEGKVLGMDGADAVFEAGGLKMRVETDSAATAGAAALSLRPEKIRLGQKLSARDLHNVFDVRVANVTFIGSILRYDVVLPSGQKLLVQAANDGSDIWSEGAELQAGWSKQNAVLLRGE